jgi:hypothetical protein
MLWPFWAMGHRAPVSRVKGERTWCGDRYEEGEGRGGREAGRAWRRSA